MNKRYLALLLMLLTAASIGIAQPLPCSEPPTMTSFCADACIICDIDGFTGRHESSNAGEAPSDFCTFVVHNAQWIAFIAGSESIEVELSVSNCSAGIGLEFALYESTDCENFNLISNCFGGMTQAVPPGSSAIINNNVPLVIGQYYYIVMDGAFGDNCDWTFNVLEGSTQVDPLTDSGNIQGDPTVCPEVTQQYFIEPPEGATLFEWTVNGILQNSDEPLLDYDFSGEGLYTICVTAKNACDEAPPTCIQVEVAAVPETVITDFLCEGDTYEIAGNTLTTGGFYQFNLQSIEGCDSLISLNLIDVLTPLNNLDLDICEGDTLFIGTTPFFSSGLYQETLVSSQGCDSIVNLDLSTIVCNINSTNTPNSVVCNGEASGSIDFVVQNGTAPFTYTWQELNGLYSGSGNINTVGSLNTIANIPAGTYVINIEDGFANVEVIIVELNEPPVLMIDFMASDFNGVNVNCADGADGELMVLGSGGSPGYTYAWSSGQSTNSIDQLSPGIYTVTVTDALGCSIADNFEMLAPDPLLLIAEFRNASCEGLSTGNITAVQTLGGVGDFLYSLNGSTFLADPVFDGLTAGDYTIQVMDGNGCIDEQSGNLTAPQIPEVELGPNLQISLGDQIELQPNLNNIDIGMMLWTSSELLECPTCQEQVLVPLNDAFYNIFVTSADGCTREDSVFIRVDKFRKLYIPNIFTPNFDGANDYFTIFGGPEVAGIRKLSIYNRWGALIFEARDIPSGIEPLGWDGSYKGKDLNPDVYSWVAEISFIDGETLMYSGDITLFK